MSGLNGYNFFKHEAISNTTLSVAFTCRMKFSGNPVRQSSKKGYLCIVSMPRQSLKFTAALRILVYSMEWNQVDELFEMSETSVLDHI